jgi:hypothetical protein
VSKCRMRPSMSLKISQLYLGKVDAKDEIVFGSADDRLLFERTYFLLSHISTDDFLSGRKFYIVGMKGTGKTALLRYLDILAKRIPETETRFILFKSQFSEEERQEASKSDPALEFADDTGRRDQPQNDYENLWRWFLHRQIASIIIDSKAPIVEIDDNFDQYLECVTSVRHPGESSGLKRLFPKFTKGQVEISKNPSLKVEFEWINKNENKVRFPDLVRQADVLFSKLKRRQGSLYLFVDEVELNLGSKRQYDRDANLIRDLIVAVYQLNTMAQENGRWLKLICAVRSEVLTAVADLGKEIDRPAFDFGKEMNWAEEIDPTDLQVLLQMICFKIAKTESGTIGPRIADNKEIWERYFKNGDAELDQEWVLQKTWYRPRDVVTLLSLVKDKYPDHWSFQRTCINTVWPSYSRYRWRDIGAELAVKYNKSQQRGIHSLFTQFKRKFTFDEFDKRANDLRSRHREVEDLLSMDMTRHDLLRDLYRAGMIGNVHDYGFSFSFRGSAEINLGSQMCVHEGLWPEFSLGTGEEIEGEKIEDTRRSIPRTRVRNLERQRRSDRSRIRVWRQC